MSTAVAPVAARTWWVTPVQWMVSGFALLVFGTAMILQPSAAQPTGAATTGYLVKWAPSLLGVLFVSVGCSKLGKAAKALR